MKKTSALYEYLETTGVLQTGSSSDIKHAKNKYWSLVRKEWRKQQRKECRSFTVFFKPKEYSKLKNEAANRSVSATRLIKEATLGSLEGSSGINKETLGQIRQTFFESYNHIDKEVPVKNGDTKNILRNLLLLEKKVFDLLL